MKIQKSIIHMVLCFLFIAGAYAQPVQLRVADSTYNTTVGSIISVPVFADSTVTGMAVLAYQIRATFSSNVLSPIGVITSGTMVSPFGPPAVNTSITGEIRVAGAGVNPLVGQGVFIYLQFQVLTHSATWVTINHPETFLNEGNPAVVLDDGYQWFPTPPVIYVYPSSSEFVIGETGLFYGSSGTAPYTYSTMDTNVASINPISGVLTAKQVGQTKVLAVDTLGVSGQTGGFAEVRGSRVWFPDTVAQFGTTMDVPLYVTDLTGQGIVSGDFSLTYSSSRVTPISIVQSGTLIQSYGPAAINITAPGTLNFSFAGSTPLTGSGVLLYIRFNLHTPGYSQLSFSNTLFNQSIDPITVNESINVQAAATLNISPYSATMVAGEQLLFQVTSGGTPPYSWSVSDTSAAEINASGLLTAKRSGVVKVTATDAVAASGTNGGNITIYDTRVVIPDTSYKINEFFNLPVFIGALPSGQSIHSLQGTFSFRSPELDFISIVPNGSLSNGWAYYVNEQSNTVSFASASPTPLTGPGVLFYIRFLLTADLAIGENAYVNMNNILFNEGIPLPLIDNGSITGDDCIPINIFETVQDVSCAGGNDGSISVNVNGGIPPYTYSWSNGESGTSIDTLSSAYYYITVTDAVACAFTKQILVSQPSYLSASVSTTDVSCFGGNDGSANISLSGATPPYLLLWSNGATTEANSNLSSGLYDLSITDDNNCETIRSGFVNEPAVLNASATVSDVSSPGGSDGSIVLLTTGGTFPYNFLWSNGATIENLVNITAGTYTVSVTDDNSCLFSDSYIVTEPGACLVTDSLWESRITPDSARLHWNPAPGAWAYQIRGRLQGSPVLITINIAPGSPDFKNVFGLGNNKIYEWQIRSLCNLGADTSAWSSLNSFMTGCFAPDSTWTSSISSNGSVFNWTKVASVEGYEVRGRIQGSPSWVVLPVAGANTTSKNILGLSPSTTYEWKVKSVCSTAKNSKSDNTATLSFTTLPLRLGNHKAISGIELYPNPTRNLLNIDLNSQLELPVKLRIFNALGELVRSSTLISEVQRIDIGDLAEGVYLIKIKTATESARFRIVKSW